MLVYYTGVRMLCYSNRTFHIDQRHTLDLTGIYKVWDYFIESYGCWLLEYINKVHV